MVFTHGKVNYFAYVDAECRQCFDDINRFLGQCGRFVSVSSFSVLTYRSYKFKDLTLDGEKR